MVIIWHYANCQGASQLGWPFDYITGATRLFWSGVDLFFVLSGFLIGGILIDNEKKKGFYKTFYIRRAARIIPLYVCLLSLFFICRATLDNNVFSWLFNDNLPDISYLTFTQNIFMGLAGTMGGHFLGITWSLAVEEQFYVAAPLILFLVGPARFLRTAIALAIIAPVLRLLFPGFTSIVNMPLRMDSLLIGVVLSFGFRSEAFTAHLVRNKLFLWITFLALLSLMGLMTFRRLGRDFLEPLGIATFYGVFISLAIIYRGKPVTAVLRSHFLTKLGMYSYGLYMYHQMISGLVHGYFRHAPPALDTAYGVTLTLLSLFLTAGVAFMSYHTLESYFLRLGKRFKYTD